jgi:hypothetical protein
MLPELSATASAYALGLRFLDNLVKDFTAEDWAVQDACGHNPRWIVGHLATYRHRVLGLMGLQDVPAPWEAVFAKGTSSTNVPAELDMGDVVATFHAAHATIMDRWDDLTPEALAKPIGRTLPDGTDDVGNAIRFLAWHEAYHLGQLALLRRLTGKPGLA